MPVIVTKELLASGLSSKGGWSKEQILALGGERTIPRRWKRRIIGKVVSDEAATKFLALRDAHLTKLRRLTAEKLARRIMRLADKLNAMVARRDADVKFATAHAEAKRKAEAALTAYRNSKLR